MVPQKVLRRRSSSPEDPTPPVAGASSHSLSQHWARLRLFFLFFFFHLSLISCPGVIYSDIGTSPLYVLNGIWPATEPAPSKEDVIGGISAIVWSMSLLPLLKYVGLHCLDFGYLS